MRVHTSDWKAVADYARLPFPDVAALPWPVYLLLRRDALLHLLRQSDAGRAALEAFCRLGQHDASPLPDEGLPVARREV